MLTIVLLSVLILLHELGHFWAARKMGVKVEEFGIGIPPKALTLGKRGDTEFTLNWLPIGGFVRLLGENGDMGILAKLNPFERRRAFSSKSAWQRAFILVAGVTANLLVGVLLFTIIYSVLGVPRLSGQQVVVTQIAPGSPADMAGITTGDVVVQLGDHMITSSTQFVSLVAESGGREISLGLATLNQTDGTVSQDSRQVSVLPRTDPPEGEGALGVAVTELPILSYEKKPWYQAPFYGAVEGVKEAYAWTRVMLTLFMHPVELWKGVSGPIEVVKIGQEQAASGILSFIRFGGIISFNLAVFNLLPFPALDGGRIVFLFIEKLIGKKRTSKYEGYVNAAGMIALLLLMVVVTIRDLSK